MAPGSPPDLPPEDSSDEDALSETSTGFSPIGDAAAAAGSLFDAPLPVPQKLGISEQECYLDLIAALNMVQWKGMSPLDYPEEAQPGGGGGGAAAGVEAQDDGARAAVVGAAVAASVDALPVVLQPFDLGGPLAALGWTGLRKQLVALAAVKGKTWVKKAIASLVSGQFYQVRGRSTCTATGKDIPHTNEEQACCPTNVVQNAVSAIALRRLPSKVFFTSTPTRHWLSRAYMPLRTPHETQVCRAVCL